MAKAIPGKHAFTGKVSSDTSRPPSSLATRIFTRFGSSIPTGYQDESGFHFGFGPGQHAPGRNAEVTRRQQAL